MSLYFVSRTGNQVLSISDDQLKRKLSKFKSVLGIAGYYVTELNTLETCASGHYKFSNNRFGAKCKKCPPGEYTVYTNNNVLWVYCREKIQEIPYVKYLH